MSETVWISVAPGHASNMRRLQHSFSNAEQEYLGLEWAQRNMNGEPLGAEFFPSEVWGIVSSKERDYKLPDVFRAGGVWVVSSGAADVMRQFDLGDGRLYPVKVMKRDHSTPIGEDWFCINFGNQKSALIPQESPNMRHRYIRHGEKGWCPPYVTNDFDVNVAASALPGPDIWIDPNVGDAFFLSDRLGRALKKAKADTGFFLSKSRVIEG